MSRYLSSDAFPPSSCRQRTVLLIEESVGYTVQIDLGLERVAGRRRTTMLSKFGSERHAHACTDATGVLPALAGA